MVGEDRAELGITGRNSSSSIDAGDDLVAGDLEDSVEPPMPRRWVVERNEEVARLEV